MDSTCVWRIGKNRAKSILTGSCREGGDSARLRTHAKEIWTPDRLSAARHEIRDLGR